MREESSGAASRIPNVEAHAHWLRVIVCFMPRRILPLSTSVLAFTTDLLSMPPTMWRPSATTDCAFDWGLSMPCCYWASPLNSSHGDSVMAAPHYLWCSTAQLPAGLMRDHAFIDNSSHKGYGPSDAITKDSEIHQSCYDSNIICCSGLLACVHH